jgi:hypothetical protein
MNIQSIAIASLASLLLAAAPAPATAAPAAEATETGETSRQARPFSVSGVGTFYVGANFPLVGVELAYHLFDRLAVTGQMTTFMGLFYDFSAGARTFILGNERSGLTLGLTARHFAAIMSEGSNGAGAEVGYEYRAQNGFLLSLGLGYILANAPECYHCRQDDPSPRWIHLFAGTVRIGKAF